MKESTDVGHITGKFGCYFSRFFLVQANLLSIRAHSELHQHYFVPGCLKISNIWAPLVLQWALRGNVILCGSSGKQQPATRIGVY